NSSAPVTSVMRPRTSAVRVPAMMGAAYVGGPAECFAGGAPTLGSSRLHVLDGLEDRRSLGSGELLVLCAESLDARLELVDEVAQAVVLRNQAINHETSGGPQVAAHVTEKRLGHSMPPIFGVNMTRAGREDVNRPSISVPRRTLAVNLATW